MLILIGIFVCYIFYSSDNTLVGTQEKVVSNLSNIPEENDSHESYALPSDEDHVKRDVTFESISSSQEKMSYGRLRKRIEDKDSIIKLLSDLPRKPVGEIQRENGLQHFYYGDELIMSAVWIGKVQSQSENGTIAFDAITGDATPITRAEVETINGEVKLKSSHREIWLHHSNGGLEKVSPQNIDSYKPLISPQSQTVVFTGRLLSDSGIPGGEQLYVLNLKTKEYTNLGLNNDRHGYAVSALYWSEKEKTLWIIETWGETGSRMIMSEIEF